MHVGADPTLDALPAPARLQRPLGLFGRIMLRLCGRFFRRIALEGTAGLSSPVIYVLRAFSRLERLYVEWAVRRKLLPSGPVLFLRPRSGELESLVLSRPQVRVVPLAFIWGRPPVNPAESGEDEEPPLIRLLRTGSSVKVGAPLLVGAFLGEHPSDRDEVLSRRLRWEISGRLERERRVVLGPPRKTARRLKKEILRSRRLRAELADLAAKEALPLPRALERARKLLGEIAADIRPWTLRMMQPLFRFVWDRIYDGIDIDQAGIERVRAAARQGPLILCPSHKSHIDYLVLPWVFYENGLVLPHAAAGANLSFWPLGFIFRRCGAFFLRRTFKGNPLYAAVFRAYMRKLVDERVPIEFFIEGGRSRTGKLLQPRLGLVSMICDAARARPDRRPQVVPISILYDKVIEEKSYVDELGGGEKKPEDMRGLLGAGKVLTARYGRVDIQFDEPFDLLTALGPDTESEEALRLGVRRVAHRIVYGIAHATAVTPSALWASALLASGTRGMPRADAEQAIAVLESCARRAGARLTEVYERDRPAALERALDLLVGGKLVEKRDDLLVVPEERRPGLDYYKNNALNWFVAESIIARAHTALRRQASPVAQEALRERTRELSRLLKLEFVYRVGATFEVIFEENLGGMIEAGWLRRQGGAIEVAEGGAAPLALLSGLCENFVEAYWAAARALPSARTPIATKELTRAALERAERMFLQGEIRRRESVTKTTLTNAVEYFLDQGVLEAEAGKLRLAHPAGVEAVAEAVRFFLG